MKQKDKQIFTAKDISKIIGISIPRIYVYIKDGKIHPDFYHNLKSGRKLSFFTKDSLCNIKKWHDDFKKSKKKKINNMLLLTK